MMTPKLAALNSFLDFDNLMDLAVAKNLITIVLI